MSDSYKYKQYGVDDTSNTCANPALSEVLEARFSRRSLLQGTGALGVAGVLSGSFATLAEAASVPFAKGRGSICASMTTSFCSTSSMTHASAPT